MKSIPNFRFQLRLFSLLVIASLLTQLGFTTPVLAASKATVQSAPFTTCADVTEIPQAECEALTALYNSTDGPGWTTNTNWLATDTPCGWYGVACGWGHVTSLNLDANQLTGSIPTQLDDLILLSSLSLSQNQLSGSIPVELGNLVLLQNLSLWENQLAGNIPTELGNLTQLEYLILCDNQLTGTIPAELGSLTQLVSLCLSNNQLSGEIPASITNLVNLTSLRFDCGLTSSDPAVIAFLNEKSPGWQCLPNLFIIVQPENDSVFGFYWPVGALLTLEIDDPATPQIPDYTDSQVFVGSDDWENGFELGGIFDIQPGHVVTVSDGNITRQHTVTHLAVTNIDIDADTVSGTGYPGALIHVGALTDENGNNTIYRNINVNAEGVWLADFSVPAEPNHGGAAYDIRLGTGSGAYEFDEDEDATSVGWQVPNHTFSVRANYDLVAGSEWVLGSTIMIEIDDPATQTNPDYTDTATVGLADWDPSQTYFEINTDNYDLKLGDVVTVSDGDITKQLTVANFMITDVDLDTDQVYGIADPGQYVNIWTCWQSDPCVNRDETADQDGNWMTNFAIPGEQDWEQETANLRAGSWIDSSVSDEDGDSTMFGWYVPIPRIDARANGDWVEGFSWEVGVSVTLEIDDPVTTLDPDYTTTGVVGPASNPADYSYIEFHFGGEYDLKPGDEVILTDGTTPKETVVTGVSIISINPHTDIVTGTAEAGSLIHVNACDVWNCPVREEVTDEFGHWTSDFSDPSQPTFDIMPGTWVDAGQTDNDGDNTMFGVEAPNLPYTVADFDGDGDTDISYFRPSTGRWYVIGKPSVAFGASGDIPVPADYDGDGDTDLAYFRPATGRWNVLGTSPVAFGASGDIPVPGDYDGDGDADIAYFRPSNGRWYILGQSSIAFGLSGVIPVPGDYDGDGDTDLAYFRPSNNRWYVLGQPSVAFGASGAIPVAADYDGDGDTDLAYFRPSNNRWYVLGKPSVAYGASGILPVPGDYDGDGDTDIAYFRPSTGRWYVLGKASVAYGTVGDFPLPVRDTNGDGDPYQ